MLKGESNLDASPTLSIEIDLKKKKFKEKREKRKRKKKGGGGGEERKTHANCFTRFLAPLVKNQRYKVTETRP